MTVHFIGRDDRGARVFIRIKVETEQRDTVTTVQHETFAPANYPRLSITGMTVTPSSAARRDFDSGGQIYSTLLHMGQLAPGWTADDVASLHALWQRWHLNDMRAGCAHMVLPEDKSYDARKDIRCPDTGYKYGSAWLLEPLQDTALAEAGRLMGLQTNSASIPNWLQEG